MKELRIRLDDLEVSTFATASDSTGSAGVRGPEITGGGPDLSQCRCPIGWSNNDSCPGSTCGCGIDVAC